MHLIKTNILKVTLAIAILSIASKAHSAAVQDTLWVQLDNGKPYFNHIVSQGEGSLALARRYAVLTNDLIEINKLDLKNGLTLGDTLKIPVTKSNIQKNNQSKTAIAIYHKVDWGETVSAMARYMQTTPPNLLKLNNLSMDNGVKAGQVILLGWVTDRWDSTGHFVAGIKQSSSTITKKPTEAVNQKADSILNAKWIEEKKKGAGKTDISSNKTSIQKQESVGVIDSVTAPKLNQPAKPSSAELLYNHQTSDGQIINEDKGAALFYTVGGANMKNFYFAQTDDVPVGLIIKVVNPGTGKYIFAKVIDKKPSNGTYTKAKVVLSINAKQALGVTDKSVFCNYYYGNL